MQDLKFNRVHKNGWLSWRLPGVKGAVFIDKRMLTPEALANPPQTLEEALNQLVPAGVDSGSNETDPEKLAAMQAKEEAKAAKAAAASTKANERLAKLQASAQKAQERAEAAKAKAMGAGAGAPATEQAADVAAL